MQTFDPKSAKTLEISLLEELADELDPPTPAERVSDDYLEFLETKFPHVASYPLVPRHHRVWEWFVALAKGKRSRPEIEIWPRGGGKSTTIELAVAYLSLRLTRRFVLFVCETQDQADKHVQAVATLLERLGIERKVGKYGNSKGWRRDQLRTRSGFNCAGIGLDVATRGVKLDEFRPDLMVIDDVDNQKDTPRTIEKKIETLTLSILPAGSDDCSVVGVQNLIHQDGVFAQMLDNRADFLHDRVLPEPERAVNGLVTQREDQEDGSRRIRIVSGEATWSGQSIEVCERQISDWGLTAFLREAQHEVQGVGGYFFDVDQLDIISEVTEDLIKLVRGWDLAATEGGGDWTAGVLIGIGRSGVLYILDVVRGQWASNNVRAQIDRVTAEDKGAFGSLVSVRLPQDPAQAGKDQAEQMRERLAEFTLKIKTVTGRKAIRARTLQEKVNTGNAKMLKGAWNHDFKEELRRFREDEQHLNDDQVDAGSDATNELVEPKKTSTVTPMHVPPPQPDAWAYMPR